MSLFQDQFQLYYRPVVTQLHVNKETYIFHNCFHFFVHHLSHLQKPFWRCCDLRSGNIFSWQFYKTNAFLYFFSWFSKLSSLALGVSPSNQAVLSYCFCVATGILLLYALSSMDDKASCDSIRNKVFTSQNTTSITDIYFISFKVIRWQHVSASIIGPSSGHSRMKYGEATHCNL